MRLHHPAALPLVLIAVLAGRSVSQDEAPRIVELVLLAAGQEAGRSRLEVAAGSLKGEATTPATGCAASLAVGSDGLITSYHRTVRSVPGERLVTRVTLDVRGRGYVLREESPLGARSRDLPPGRVHAVIDPAWPESLLPVFARRGQGFVQALILATGEVRSVEIKDRSGGARYLDLPGGGITWEPGSDGGVGRLLLPGEGDRQIVPASAAASGPAAPEGVIEEDVSIPAGGASLPGTLVRPRAAASRSPAVLLLADAGARDRHGDAPGGRDRLLRAVAWHLAGRGIVSLRCDKRELATGTASWEELVQDALAALAWLAAREEVDSARLAAIGHGEGGLLATVLAERKAPGLRSVITLGTPVRPLRDTLEARIELRLRAAGAGDDALEQARSDLRKDLDALAGSPAGTDPGPGRRVLRDLLDVDPGQVLERIPETPVLALHAAQDPEVPAAHQALLRTALILRRDHRHRMQVLEGADHVFKATGTDRTLDVVRSGGADVSRPWHPEFLSALAGFLDETLAAGGAGK